MSFSADNDDDASDSTAVRFGNPRRVRACRIAFTTSEVTSDGRPSARISPCTCDSASTTSSSVAGGVDSLDGSEGEEDGDEDEDFGDLGL